MGIELNGFPDFKKRGKRIKSKLDTQLTKSLEFRATEIIKRTLGGKDVKGRPFKKYSEGYKKYKQNKGRSGKVDLTFTGQMFKSIRNKLLTRSGRRVGRLFFANLTQAGVRANIGSVKKAIHNNKLRRFFGLSPKQIQMTKAELKKALK